jgi:hypothetical protein
MKEMKTRLKTTVWPLLACALLTTPVTRAQDNITWNVAGDGVWDTTTANWTPGGGTTSTTFTSDGTVDVTFNTGAAAVTITPGTPTDHVRVVIPDSSGKVFARLKVTQ